ncbi:DUF4054 domain-containing protein [Cupriavidus sp. CV2]|uniref:DUF4054 domain-containing protein n=1 Tax=Cupriavidus ulmosensis TaxID=3065913 RepID=UPI00296AC09E|nr:DUF4054 domain-containing protein [Cupriavidus sp. CV2]MDW3684900.1 DUF4054 domain-containing protein [Cupriavidus sp. CV2]
MDAAQFRQDFPEFSDTTRYTDAVVDFWLIVAVSLVNECRWGVLTDQGIELVTAHHLVLAARDEAAENVGGIPGQMTGPLASKSVDKVSSSYDTGAATIEDGGFWNLTSYGVRYLTLAKLMGMGGVQL